MTAIEDMCVGMLWFDNDKKATFEEKLARALKHHNTKYGKATICHVSEEVFDKLCIATKQTFEEAEITIQQVDIEPDHTVFGIYMWLGVTDTKLAEQIYSTNGNWVTV